MGMLPGRGGLVAEDSVAGPVVAIVKVAIGPEIPLSRRDPLLGDRFLKLGESLS